MKTFISFLTVISAISVAHLMPAEPEDNSNLVHFFVLAVPQSTVDSLRISGRQEEEAAGTGVTEAGAFIGQIVSGVLGGDVRPIFAGSASFIGEEDVRQGVSTILANVAQPLNTLLRRMVGRFQTALGITSSTPTPRPGLLNGTAGQGQQRLPTTTGSFLYLNGDHLFDTTTVEPLPIINVKGEDGEDESSNIQKGAAVN